MSGHTPGPWEVLEGGIGWIQTKGDPYGAGGPMHIADVRGWGHLTGRGGGCAFPEAKAIAIQEANARLIAAAPELLEALLEEHRKAGFCSEPENCPTARAIAKAEGK